jgi:transposase-like protein
MLLIASHVLVITCCFPKKTQPRELPKNHQLFNAEQCQAYIHTLRWKDRALQCPRCQSHHIGRWGTYPYRPGCKRYWCHDCKRTFNDLTATLLHQSKRPLAYWILATFLLCLACSSRRIAREVGVHVRTVVMKWTRSCAERLQ